MITYHVIRSQRWHTRHVLRIGTSLDKLCRRTASSDKPLTAATEEGSAPEPPEIPKNILEPWQTAHLQKENGLIYDKKPFRMLIKKDEKYFWCLCGLSHNQPLCDGQHKFAGNKCTIKPVRFQVAKTKEYWLCNCKQTKNRPFCDGTHKRDDIIEACKYKYY